MDIETQLEQLLRREGGYVNHPNDKGGPTKYGITQAVLSEWLGHPASMDEVKNLSVELAKEIYGDRYYRAPKIDTLPEALQPQLFDIAVNSGPKKSIRMLQEVLCMAGFECAVDGVVGPGTRKKAQEAYAAMGHLLINAIAEYREHFYRQIVANNPSQAVFLKGWLNRAREFKVLCSA